jgi:hypothetical protein
MEKKKVKKLAIMKMEILDMKLNILMENKKVNKLAIMKMEILNMKLNLLMGKKKVKNLKAKEDFQILLCLWEHFQWH